MYFYNSGQVQATIEFIEKKEQEVFSNFTNEEDPVIILYTFELVKTHKSYLNRKVRSQLRLSASEIEDYVFPLSELVEDVDNFES